MVSVCQGTDVIIIMMGSWETILCKKKTHDWGAFQIIKSTKVCKDTINTSYTWDCYHTITHHIIYIQTTNYTVYFI